MLLFTSIERSAYMCVIVKRTKCYAAIVPHQYNSKLVFRKMSIFLSKKM